MIADAMRFIADLTKKANTVETHTMPGISRYAWLRHGDELTTVNIPAPDRHSIHESLDSFLGYVAAEGHGPDIFVGDDSLVAVLDSDDRRETAELELVTSDRFDVLNDLADEFFTAKSATHLLRFRLYGPHADPLIAALRQVDFTRTSSGSSTVQHGRESLGRSVEAAVQQAYKVPDSFRVRVPVWRTHGMEQFEVEVSVRVHIDLDNNGFRFIPLSDELAAGVFAARSAVRDVVANTLKMDGSVYIGRP